MNVIILGSGAWGKAIASLFQENGHKVSFWEGEKINDRAFIFCAIPTQAIRIVLGQIGSPTNCTFVNGAKGIEKDTHLLPYQIVTEILPNVDYLTLMGPSFSDEVMKKMPTLVNLGYRNEKTALHTKELLQTDYFRIKLTKSVRALELSAAFKNICAIVCGVAEGLGYGVNTRVKLMLLAMEELNYLRQKLKFEIDTNALPATIGDLILTCSSEESRNFRFGKILANNSPSKSLEKVGSTVEGYYTTESVSYFEHDSNVKLPLARFVFELTHGSSNKNVHERFKSFVKKI